MTFQQFPNLPRYDWYVEKPKRVRGFRWALVPDRWFHYEPDSIFLYPVWLVWTAIVIVLWLVDYVVLVPTIGPIRLAIHHARSPGWYLRVMRATAGGMRTPELELHTSTKSAARELRSALAQQFRQGADLNTPSVRATIAASHAVVTPQHAQPGTI